MAFSILKNNIRVIFSVLTLGLVLLSSSVLSQDVVFYRYIDESGVKVISSQIPSKYVKRGYDVITKEGRLIETIEPEPTGEEKIKLLRIQKEKERIEAWDNELLKRYSHPDDIKEAQKRKLAQNKNSIAIVQRNIDKIDEEIDRYQALAAADEREGRDVSSDTLRSIELLKRERSLEYSEIVARQKEREEIIDGYTKDIERFKIIRPNR